MFRLPNIEAPRFAGSDPFNPRNLPYEAAGMIARCLVGSHLTESTVDYRPERFVDLTPDEVMHVDTSLGNMPAYIYNADAFGVGPHADIYHHASLLVRADQGFVTPTLDHLRKIAIEQDRALIAIGAPGSGGRLVSPAQVAKTTLLGMAKATHQVVDEIESRKKTDVGPQIHAGASLGGYIALAMASELSAEKRDRLSLPEREVALAMPIAPAGWHLRPHQIVSAIRQFTQYEPGHIVDKASYMEFDERDEYFQSLMLTTPLPTAIPTYAKLTREFLRRGDLEKVIAGIPGDTKIRGIAFDGDHVTLPHVLVKHVVESDRFTDGSVEVKIGRHLSLDSFRKVMDTVIGPVLAQLYLEELQR